MRKHTAEERHKITIRVGKDLLEEIRKIATRDNRSVNNYTLQLLMKQLTLDSKQK